MSEGKENGKETCRRYLAGKSGPTMVQIKAKGKLLSRTPPVSRQPYEYLSSNRKVQEQTFLDSLCHVASRILFQWPGLRHAVNTLSSIDGQITSDLPRDRFRDLFSCGMPIPVSPRLLCTTGRSSLGWGVTGIEAVDCVGESRRASVRSACNLQYVSCCEGRSIDLAVGGKGCLRVDAR
jgi:hypothetical protein